MSKRKGMKMEKYINNSLSLRKLRNKINRYLPIYLMALPGIAYLILNNYIPMAGVIIAFKNYNIRDGIWGSAWAGFSNFEYLFKTQDAWIITRNTILYNIVFIITGTVLSIFIAILLNEITHKFLSRFYQTVILLPYLISMVVVSYIVFAFLSMDTGLVNSLLTKLGGEGILWYSKTQYWPFILVLVNCWKSFGFNTIIYYAVIVGIDHSFYEAAMVDGASRIRQIIRITLPSLKPTVIILTILAVGRIFYSDFGLFYQVPMDAGALYPVTNVIDTYVYRGLFYLGDYSMSSAASLYQSFVGFILVISANFIVRKLDADNALF